MLGSEHFEQRLLDITQELIGRNNLDDILAKLASTLIEEGHFQQVIATLYDRDYDPSAVAEAEVVRQLTLALGTTTPPRSHDHAPTPMVLPLQVRGRDRGQITLVPHQTSRSLPEQELQYYQALVNIAGIALDQAQHRIRLEELSIRDDLTGCYNRRYFIESLQRETSWAKRYERTFSLLILDCDGLKGINDAHGHLVGDTVLRTLGAILRENLRASDLACRYGGDEFAVLLPETSKVQAHQVALRIVRKIERYPLRVGRQRLRLSASFGLSGFPQDGETLEALIEVADQECYRAKAAKKGQQAA